MVRYVNIRNFYISVIGGGIGRIVLYVVIMAVWVFIGGVVSTHGIIDNWQSKNAMAIQLCIYLCIIISISMFIIIIKINVMKIPENTVINFVSVRYAP